jgi:hypothetical protein
VNVFAEDAALVGLGGVPNTENGSEESRVVAAGAFAVEADSKKEKSASAQASIGSSRITEAEGGVLGLTGFDSKVLDANAEKLSSSVPCAVGSSALTS